MNGKKKGKYFCMLVGPHSGENLAERFEHCCRELGILTKILACTTDSASNNLIFMRTLETICKNKNIEFDKYDRHVRCIAHVLNLAVQDALVTLKAGEAKDEDELLDEQDRQDTVGADEIIPRLRKLIVKIRSSPQRREKFARQCNAAGVKEKEVILDVKTRWNSTFFMLERAIELREPLENMTATDRELSKFRLEGSEWERIKKIQELLQIFSRATKHVSSSHYPTLASSIPVYNWLLDKLEDFEEKANADIKEGIKKAIEKLKTYYIKTDSSVYAVATALDPRLKLYYYEEHGWEEEYIVKAKETVSQIYRSQYGLVGAIHQQSDEEDDDLIAHIYKKRLGEEQDEFELYLKAPRAPGKADALQWWKAHESEYPHLAALARDYLAIPATSVPVERAFSSGTDLVSKKRCNLGAQTIRACMCLKSWWQSGLINE